MDITIYALKNCDSCKKAIKAVQAAGYQFIIKDVRDDGVPETVLAELLATHGSEVVINRKSTTWRNLGEDERANDPLDLLKAHPTLLKRPVIIADGKSNIGWNAEVQGVLGI